MGHRPTQALWGIGTKTARRLSGLGIDTVDDLARADAAWLADQIGPTTGPWLRRLGRGIDPSPVDPTPWVARGHGREETFQTDLTSWDQVRAEVQRLALKVADDVAAEGRPVYRVGLKVRFRPFFTISRSHKLAAPTADPQVMAAEAVALLDRVERDRAIRLLGVRLELVPPEAGY